ncbi:hypothetical protein [Mucilaginibacter sp. SP1R1]|uniref:hypothetical protein n=1 Tax=Mucilaginibacter sp. SP1R1 TaxID=2723091 RepID=UPI00160C9CD5|nr:hypothetical protein [Mucilaginibacter sp. SP1R1]MBB6148312.1 hypothetical protein [Mucilaginibacter sp. SP1R1]
MKKALLFSLTVIMCFSACRKTAAVAPANLDQNYDASNRIFRIKASATMGYVLTLTETNPSSPDTPYNYQQATQSADYDYGFTPVVGHIIKVNINSPKGVISAAVYYKGIKLKALTVTPTAEGGSTVDYSYTVKD